MKRKKKFIRHFATVLLGSLLCAQTYAQHTTEFLFSETAPDYIREAMQTNTKAVFAEINRAYDQNKSGLSLSSTNVTGEASQRIQTLWKTSRFYCTETGITTRVLKSSNGYQVRNIPVFFVEGSSPEDQYQDIVIEFTAVGKISDMYIAIMPHQYAKIMMYSNEVTDLRYRQMIVELVENFRTAYNRKDLPFLEDIYSEDALIITGKVLRQQKRGDVPMAYDQQKVEYSVQNKKQYLGNLKRVFERNSYINIKFDEIVVTRHEGNPNIYGVTLKQDWNASGGYHDEGWLFLMIDYEDENNPLIWVRTWQPLTDPTGKNIRYNTEDIFGLGNFPVR
ncbi:MAG: nuclear transport factor 2 family protein [Dysgonamonadaceae bacterium]|jgi:hypothetical protein|nr:nuclear transport factor 2 family protein [Dysgonamonadaceae bacterium]